MKADKVTSSSLAKADDLIENLFATESSPGLDLVKKAKGGRGSKEVALAPKKRLTKKQKKVMEQQSEHRSIVDIISDTKSGEPLKNDKTKAAAKRKREEKAQAKKQGKDSKAIIAAQEEISHEDSKLDAVE